MEFDINGIQQQLSVEDSTPLLYVLRNQLKLKSARFGCGEGYCGACTVLVNGKAVQSCTIEMCSVAGGQVTTIECLKEQPEKYRDLSQLCHLFVEEQAAQCGYCIPGIIMSAYSFVSQNPETDENSLMQHLSKTNLCRCGAHYRISKALKKYLVTDRVKTGHPKYALAD